MTVTLTRKQVRGKAGRKLVSTLLAQGASLRVERRGR